MKNEEFVLKTRNFASKQEEDDDFSDKSDDDDERAANDLDEKGEAELEAELKPDEFQRPAIKVWRRTERDLYRKTLLAYGMGRTEEILTVRK